MGKKLKVGKTRKDKFYHLAKETGYRSRSSFKLIQLNRKFQFLQKARAVLDLCAAPGGWLQVASKFMPVSSLIIGVDLVPIKPIPNVVALQEDITTEKCRQALRKELQTWKVDVVLNDGAPNVGANWQHDAFSQANLTLMALKLACEFLAKGGTFVTKVFRSKDYQPLMWIFQQFFKKVQATKPQASRNESAEIFVICQSFLAPDKIDNKFFDPKYAFKEVEVQVKTVKELVNTKKPKAEGYDDGDLTLYHTFSVTEFLRAENPVDFLSKANEISFDDAELESHSATSEEIKECCRDIKVLGRKELRLLLSWRAKLRRHVAKKVKEDGRQTGQEISMGSDEESDSDGQDAGGERAAPSAGRGDDDGEDEEEEMDKKLAQLKAEEIAELKRKKKRLLKDRRKQRERVELKMDLPGVSIADGNDNSMFSLNTINKAKALCEISGGDMKAVDALLDEDEEGEDDVYFSDEEEDKISLASDLDSDDMEEVEQKEKEMDKKPKKKVTFSAPEEDEEEGQDNELLVDLEEKDEKKERETSMWFSKGIFSELELDEETDALKEIRQTQILQSKQATTGRKRKAEEQPSEEQEKEEEGPSQEVTAVTQEKDEESGSDSDDDSSSDDEKDIAQMKRSAGSRGNHGDGDNDDDFQVVPVESTSKKARVLTPEGLALGTEIATSKKKSRDLIDGSFHRFASSETTWGVPAWFVDDEKKHRKKPIPVSKEMVEEYKQRWREIDARPIKKVAEAKSRKKRRMLKKMEQAKKKAEAVVNTVDISEREKMAQLRSIYKKAGVGKEKRDVTYIVAKKGAGRKVPRPSGVKGQFRVVDSRMKKDMRGLQRKEQRERGGKGGGGKGRGGKRGGPAGRGGRGGRGGPAGRGGRGGKGGGRGRK
ncbi:pre-rRNA 2'-O-ribose RNA methyltransferase FTSJ3 [Alosa pseudoharengus]|uniref:pre-rRNA 2'-O-ribose RNA methyltransferase FTSJ3 n=1 Tax=Alosa pseudoharengus TaxID=34774 RepID=UPI003F887371